jgi:hypothetical protein
MDYIALGVDFHAIRNRNEDRVIELLDEVLEEFPDFCPRREDIEDVYALALNMLPARYTQQVYLIMEEPVTDEMIRLMLREAVRTVMARPHV